MTAQPATKRLTTGTDRLPAGRPHSRVFIELRTRSALRLVTGRPSGDGKAAIIGLFGFADRLRCIWAAAKNDDPYAWWWLTKVETALAAARSAIHQERASAKKSLSNADSLGIDLSRDNYPRRIELLFACPYAYFGAQLVKQFDNLITELDTCVQIGARRRSDATKTRRNGERVLRHLFSTSQGYWDFGMTPELIRQQTPMAIDAEAKMGRVPDEILNRRRRPRLLDSQEHAVVPGDAGE